MRRLWNTRSRTVRLKPARWWNKTYCVSEQLYGALCNYLHDIIIAYDIRSETRARPAYCILQRIRITRSSLLRCSCQLTHIARSVRTKLCTQRVGHGRAPMARELCVQFNACYLYGLLLVTACQMHLTWQCGRSNEPEIAKWICNERAHLHLINTYWASFLLFQNDAKIGVVRRRCCSRRSWRRSLTRQERLPGVRLTWDPESTSDLLWKSGGHVVARSYPIHHARWKVCILQLFVK